MTDIAPVPAPVNHHGRLRRMLMWIRDYDSERARNFYLRTGIWSSRVYAVLLPMAVLLTAWADPTPGIAFMIGMFWGLLSRWYLWYQAKAILAYPIIQEEQANSDQINSFMPLVAIVALVILWAVLHIMYYIDMAAKPISYTYLGWFMIVVAIWDTIYDLRINNKIMFILARVPSRVEFSHPRPPHE